MSRTSGSTQPHCIPNIGLDQASRSWFILNGAVYAVDLASTDQFKAFVGQIALDKWRDNEARALLDQATLDMCGRWFVLLSLDSAHIAVPLYNDRQSTENALRDKLERTKNRKVQLHVKKAIRRSKRVHSDMIIAS